ncbi:MAG: CotH kinase family protein [Fibrobacterales bacterium]
MKRHNTKHLLLSGIVLVSSMLFYACAEPTQSDDDHDSDTHSSEQHNSDSSNEGHSGTTASPDDPSSEDHSGTSGNPETADSDYIFNDDAPVKVYNILIEPDALERLDADPMAEVYESAHIVFEGDTIRDIQVRYKGGRGAWYPCGDSEHYGLGGIKTCIKLSTKVKFNTDTDPDRKFFSLKKLQFHHMHHYDSQLRERIAYWFHREMGNPAPRLVHAQLKINDELIGLFSLVEQVDGRFTREHWEDGEGNLYKELLPVAGDSLTHDTTFMNALKTNEDENPTFTAMQTFEQEILDASTEDEIKEVISKWWDVPQLVSTILTSAALRHWDSPYLRIQYMGHNSYWYSDPTEGKLYSIPWDTDNAHLSIHGRPNDFSKDHMKHEDVLDALQCESPVDNQFMGHWLCFPDEAKEALDRLINDVYPMAETMIDKWKGQINDATKEAYTTHGDGFPKTGALKPKKWKAAIAEEKKILREGLSAVEEWYESL